MPVPSSISDLSSTASSNYPSGSESIGTSLDDYLRAHASIIKQVSDAKADTSHTHTASNISDSTAAGRTLLTAVDAAAQRTALGLVIGTDVQAYDSDIPTVSASQAEMEAGTETALRSMSPLRVKQAITALVPAPTAINSMVRLNTANGYGSTNTKIRRFTNTVTNVGSDITYADSATNGASFTINTAGVYAISYNDQFSGGGYIGISVNSSQLTTSIESITVSDIAAVAYMANSNAPVFVGCTLRLAVNDVIRAHNSGSVTGAVPNACQFTITRVD